MIEPGFADFPDRAQRDAAPDPGRLHECTPLHIHRCFKSTPHGEL